jgi:signal transduction histidine kinase/ActR/RegA family two-component response regulator
VELLITFSTPTDRAGAAAAPKTTDCPNRAGAPVHAATSSGKSTDEDEATNRLIIAFGLGVVYFVAGKLGLAVAFVHPSATPIWAPAGIALAAVLVLGYRVWPVIMVGAFLVNFTTKGSWETSLAIAVGNTLEALVGGALAERFANGARCFVRRRDVVRFVLFTGLMSTMVSATVGVTTLSLAGYARWSDYGSIWLTWWLGDTGGDLVVAPFLVLWATDFRLDWDTPMALEASALLLAIAVLGVFVTVPWPPLSGYPVAFLSFPLILWAAFGFGPRETATVVLLLSVVAVWRTLHGFGPFAVASGNESLLLLDSFLVVASLTGLGLAAVVHEQQSTAQALKNAERRLQGLLRYEQAERRQAEAISKEKDQFLAVLGHELRSPLSALMHAIAALQQATKQEPRSAQLHSIIDRQAQYLAHLVDDLLDVSRLDSGKIRLAVERLDLKEIVELCLSSFGEAGAWRERTVSTTLEPAWVRADATRLYQVVTNLLDNATKFTSAGGRIDVTVRPNDGQAVLEVKDNGRGIDPATLPRVFDFFAQADDSLDRSHGGLGIGLTIVRRLVEMHDGRVEARSAGPGQGSEFVVRLPLQDAPPARLAPSPSLSSAVQQCLRVLVVEDYEDSRMALEVCLGLLGHSVQSAADGLRGVELAREWRPDAALVDIGLPGLDGYDVAKRIRSTPAGSGMLLVAITGYGQAEVRQRALEAGFNECLVKPVNPQDLGWLLSSRSPAAVG